MGSGCHNDWGLFPLKLKFHGAVNPLTWMLGIKPRSSARQSELLIAEPSLQFLKVPLNNGASNVNTLSFI